MNKTEATVFLKSIFYLSINNQIIKKRLDICSALVENLNCYGLSFRPDESIWRFLDDLAK